MPTSQNHIDIQSTKGANLAPEQDGATFRVGAPGALDVFVSGSFTNWSRREEDRLVKDDHGYWAGFVRGVEDGDPDTFHVVGNGSRGSKRDPRARALSTDLRHPRSNCFVLNWVNPITAGNGGGVTSDGPPRHGMSNAAGIVIPANGLLVFARAKG